MIKSIEDVARLCHHRNKIYCEAHGDMSIVDWEDTPQDIRESVIDGVKYVISNYPASLNPAQTHQRWIDRKLSEGWVYGTVKDYEKKTHPCLVPYPMLDRVQRTKDRLFINTVMECVPIDYQEG